MSEMLYPIKFVPILKEKIWGGQKLKKVFNKKSHLLNIGESWEISDVEGDISIVSNGYYKGKSLETLLKILGPDLVGEQNYNIFKNKFPLLIKFIDARENLSIQLHPNDELAKERHGAFGKTEMWYVVQAEEDSNLIVGFNQKVTPEKYLKHLKEKTLTNILNIDKVKAGDTYFIEVGRIHAIGAGVMLAEIQQTSDITYRVYDWDRVDDCGKERELHNDLAIEAIDFNMSNNFKIPYTKNKNVPNTMVKCPYFQTNYLEIAGTLKKQNKKDSFVIYMCVKGNAIITYKSHSEYIQAGETVLMPAKAIDYEITSKKAKFLEVYV